jgi:hypothetical protein
MVPFHLITTAMVAVQGIADAGTNIIGDYEVPEKRPISAITQYHGPSRRYRPDKKNRTMVLGLLSCNAIFR